MSDLDLLEEEELDLSAGLEPFPPGVHPDALPPDFADWDRDAAGNITNYDAPPNEELDLSAGARSVLQPVKTQTQSKQQPMTKQEESYPRLSEEQINRLLEEYKRHL